MAADQLSQTDPTTPFPSSLVVDAQGQVLHGHGPLLVEQRTVGGPALDLIRAVQRLHPTTGSRPPVVTLTAADRTLTLTSDGTVLVVTSRDPDRSC